MPRGGRKIRLVEHLSVPGRQQPEKPAERRKIPDGQDVAHVPFQIGLDIGGKPQVRVGRGGENFRESSGPFRNGIVFLQRHGEQPEDGGATGHGFRDALHER